MTLSSGLSIGFPISNNKLHVSEETFQLLKNGSEIGFLRLYRSTSSALFLYSYRLCGDHEMAEDCLQMVYIKLCSNIKNIQSSSHLKFWLFKVMSNITKNYYRNKIRYFSALKKATPIMNQTDIEEDNDIHKYITNLKPIYKEIILLRFQQNLSLQEISKVLQKPLGTTKSRLFTALQKIRKNMERKAL